MKKFYIFILSVLFSTAGFASIFKKTDLETMKKQKDFKPLLRQEKAKNILEINKNDDTEEIFEIKNKKYVNNEETKNEKNIKILKQQQENIKILTANYKNILNLSSSCCVANIVEKIKLYNMNKNKTMQKNIIDFLTIDANTYYVQNTCLLLSDIAINNIVKNKDLNNIFKSTRKDCICNNQELLKENIKNFQKLYALDKDFYKTKFIYKSKDDQGRIIEQDMNETVINILNTLENCYH